MDEEKKTIGEKVDEILKWSNDHPAAGKDEYDAKVKELEAIFNPIMTKIYQQTGGAPGGMPNFQGGAQPGAGKQPGAGPQPSSGTAQGGADDVE